MTGGLSCCGELVTPFAVKFINLKGRLGFYFADNAVAI